MQKKKAEGKTGIRQYKGMQPFMCAEGLKIQADDWGLERKKEKKRFIFIGSINICLEKKTDNSTKATKYVRNMSLLKGKNKWNYT